MVICALLALSGDKTKKPPCAHGSRMPVFASSSDGTKRTTYAFRCSRSTLSCVILRPGRHDYWLHKIPSVDRSDDSPYHSPNNSQENLLNLRWSMRTFANSSLLRCLRKISDFVRQVHAPMRKLQRACNRDGMGIITDSTRKSFMDDIHASTSTMPGLKSFSSCNERGAHSAS